eukprot:NODE_14115_length_1127_cov_7.615000.p1 GENE.NODE_14115_length_1127_cov_7.615000~~NODE_14115_length_1127_cov_7.615000.p1  ORF type:complete len:215 (-),score=26.21 NODE_14115_length_1127_cov_7.615000:393-1037(-)
MTDTDKAISGGAGGAISGGTVAGAVAWCGSFICAATPVGWACGTGIAVGGLVGAFQGPAAKDTGNAFRQGLSAGAMVGVGVGSTAVGKGMQESGPKRPRDGDDASKMPELKRPRGPDTQPELPVAAQHGPGSDGGSSSNIKPGQTLNQSCQSQPSVAAKGGGGFTVSRPRVSPPRVSLPMVLRNVIERCPRCGLLPWDCICGGPDLWPAAGARW